MPATPDDLRTVCWALPHEPSIVGKARAMVHETLAAWGLQSLADDVVLVVGELLANAITYGEPPVGLSLWAGADGFCVRVTDHGPEQPRHLDLGIEAVHGRGLTIVEALAHDSGVTPLPDHPGKTVWARWRPPGHGPEVTTLAGGASIPRHRTRQDHASPLHAPPAR
ncbi:ATP-binding protein [Streptosporangium sp. CA-135522]|uniref:ATP-binding protein n=1 Tax=Streptosporangium sp. CA-135522 TaxID=3240072 RepID=UPI003D8AE693